MYVGVQRAKGKKTKKKKRKKKKKKKGKVGCIPAELMSMRAIRKT